MRRPGKKLPLWVEELLEATLAVEALPPDAAARVRAVLAWNNGTSGYVRIGPVERGEKNGAPWQGGDTHGE